MRIFGAIAALPLAALCACDGSEPSGPPVAQDAATTAAPADYYGTLEPFASEAVYFVVTDRFVDGDPGNNQTQQGGPERKTFDRPITDLQGRNGNIGYLGGDFRGLLDNAGYIADMGFTAVWISPIVDNPDEAFTGGQRLGEGFFADRGKTGYHGYWGVNFFELDEHWPSPALDFAGLTAGLLQGHGLKTVLDIVCNHGSPAYTMPEDQPKYGEFYDQGGRLVADHENLHPSELEPGSNPLHAWFHTEPDLAELSNLDDTNPEVLDYFTAAYRQWIGQGAAAFRVDTIRHMPHAFWKQFSDRIRAEHPGFFMFGESFQFDAAKVAEHTWNENGAISVLDFPGQKQITTVFAEGADFNELLSYLHLDDGLYQNPYELMIFYDNHDMPRMAADKNGFIDAHNWLFTSRGIPVIYYGSEIAFRAGAPEHGGNRDYFGQDNVDAARASGVHSALRRIARIRRDSPALQRGLQANLAFSGNQAAFFRVYEHQGVTQSALVALNKDDAPATIEIERWLSAGTWRDADTGAPLAVTDADPRLQLKVPPHDLRVLFMDGPNTNAALAAELRRLQAQRLRRP